MIALDPRTTALVLIDLQKGIIGNPLEPRPASDVVSGSKALAAKFRGAQAPVVLVHVGFAPDFSDRPPQSVDEPMKVPPGGLPAGWSDFVDGLAEPGDLIVKKRQWGAFTGTDLDLQFRRRGVKTFVIGGVATNFGVESTVRHAWELGYDVIVAEDLCATFSTELHDFSIRSILPRLARVAASDAIAFN